jgi:hypothetical protein
LGTCKPQKQYWPKHEPKSCRRSFKATQFSSTSENMHHLSDRQAHLHPQ